MALTDYIAPNVLREVGYIYKDDVDEMIACIGDEALKQHGLINAEKLRDVMISVRKAAPVMGIHATTLQYYIDIGMVETNENNKISLLNALIFNKKAVKDEMLKQKTHIKNKRHE